MLKVGDRAIVINRNNKKNGAEVIITSSPFDQCGERFILTDQGDFNINDLMKL